MIEFFQVRTGVDITVCKAHCGFKLSAASYQDKNYTRHSEEVLSFL